MCPKNEEKLDERKKTCWLQNQNGDWYRWTVGVCMPKKEKKQLVQRIDPSAAKLERVSTTEDPWGQVQSNKKNGGQAELTNGLGSVHGAANVGPTGAFNVKPVVDNVRPHHGSSS